MSCPRCGAALNGAKGCTRCLLLLGLEPPPPLQVGKYALLEELGRGRMGTVYRARDPEMKREVALKLCRTSGEEAAQRFLADAQLAAQLEHDNIVRIYGYERVDGETYYVMRLMEGGSLEDRPEAFGADVRRAADLVATVARAVQHCHEHNVIHRDLKPGNILLDAAGRPHVADFGLALRLDVEARLTETGVVMGTPVYMAPEQAAGGEATRASDLYSLGAVLYELLTGRPPFIAETLAELFGRIADEEPLPLRSLNPRVNGDLEAICLKCLEKDPARRYDSAGALADDLGRYLRGEPSEARPLGWARRAWRWGRRHPVAAGVGAVLVIATATALAASLQQEQLSRREILAANGYAARMAAGNVLFQLQHDAESFQFRRYADQVQRPAQDPALISMLEAGQYGALLDSPLPVGVSMPRGAPPFDSWLVLDERGVERARWPAPPGGSFPRDSSHRDFFLGARDIAQAGKRSVHVSRVLDDEADGRPRLAFSTPMFGSEGTMVGVMVALASLQLAVEQDASRSVALVGPRDSPGGEYVFLAHQGLAVDALVTFDMRQLPDLKSTRVQLIGDQFRAADASRVASADRYLDPFPGFGGRWLAGLAPVGDTGLIVVVQTRYGVVLEPIARALKLVALPLFAFLLFGFTARWLQRRRRP